MTAEIIYNSSVIVSMETNQTIKIKCAGKYMLTNLEIVFKSRGRIMFGNIIIEAYAGQTVTLSCGGKKMAEDVIVYTPEVMYVPTMTSDGLLFTTSDDKIFMVKE